MINLFIDESGTMTTKYSNLHKYFVIAIIQINDNYKFKEFKGSSLPFYLKVNILKFLYYKKCFNVFYIVINNKKVDSNFYNNTARAFNYILNKDLTYLIRNNKLKMDEIYLHIDQRNTSTKTIYVLEEYLNIELNYKFLHDFNVSVKYYDSKNKIGIQVADLFANMLYSVLYDEKKSNIFEEFITNGCIKHIFSFPLEENKKED